MGTVEYNRVAHFVQVVKAGSFTVAAREVGLPKSSLSRSVSALEAELGVRLLHRTTRKLALTELGQNYYESVRPAVETLVEAHERALEHDTQPRGQVRISAAPDFLWLAPMLVEFNRKYPGVEIDVRLSTRYVDLVAENIDIAIRAGRLQDSSLVARRVATSELGLLAAPSYLKRRGRPRTVADLAKHDWVMFRVNGHTLPLTLTGPSGDESVEISGSLMIDDMAFCRAACESGAGIARLPLAATAEAVGEGRLERLLPEYSAGGGGLSVVLPSSQYVPRRVALLRDFLVARIPESPELKSR
jgi:DNA-binding transcriptional LysR family regulator